MEKLIDLLNTVQAGLNYQEIDNFIEEGIFDSLDIIRIVSLLEKEYEINIDGNDIVPEYFMNLDSLMELVAKYGK